MTTSRFTTVCLDNDEDVVWTETDTLEEAVRAAKGYIAGGGAFHGKEHQIYELDFGNRTMTLVKVLRLKTHPDQNLLEYV